MTEVRYLTPRSFFDLSNVTAASEACVPHSDSMMCRLTGCTSDAVCLYASLQLKRRQAMQHPGVTTSALHHAIAMAPGLFQTTRETAAQKPRHVSPCPCQVGLEPRVFVNTPANPQKVTFLSRKKNEKQRTNNFYRPLSQFGI